MTDKRLKELLADLDGAEWDADGDYIVDHDGLDVCAVSSTDTHKRLILSAPSLARRVIAAEKLMDDAERVMHELLVTDSWSNYEVNKLLSEITTYREANK